jgi:5-methylcytosine-specific restriction endonuclease McrA
VPLIDGGADVLANLQILCVDCHRLKTTAEARARRQA